MTLDTLPTLDPDPGFAWTPDSRQVIYATTRRGVYNLWAQPLIGGPPRQLTDFKTDRIFRFAWSPDGRQLALARGKFSTDAVFITNSK